MKNKYRIAKIEEFVDGFEFQVAKKDKQNICINKDDKINHWSKTRLFNSDVNEHNLPKLIKNKFIRTLDGPNQYYTPEIKELYIGLECEIHEHSNINEEYWEKHTITNESLESILKAYNYSEDKNKWLLFSIKIKRFNYEEIKSLGFKISEWDLEHLNAKEYFIKDVNSHNDIIIEPKSLGSGFFRLLWRTGTPRSQLYTKYSGFIKNKSEYLRLLEMLNMFTIIADTSEKCFGFNI
jgi:hypothetical protein